MTAEPASAPPAFNVQRLKKTSRATTCGSPWECNDIAAGDPAAYIGVPSDPNHQPFLVCIPCADVFAEKFPGSDPNHTPAGPASAPTLPTPPQPDPFEAVEPHRLVMPPEGEESDADLVPWDGPLCACPNPGERGFSRHRATGRWVHNGCGNPALRFADGRPDPTGLGELYDEMDAAAASPMHDLAAEEQRAAEPGDVEGDDPADEPPVEEDIPDWHTCECSRVTQKARFGRAPVPPYYTHEHCGGLLRDKHLELARKADAEGRVAGTPPEHAEEAPTDDRTAAAVDEPAAVPGAADAAGPAPDPAAATEHGDGPDGGAAADAGADVVAGAGPAAGERAGDPGAAEAPAAGAVPGAGLETGPDGGPLVGGQAAGGQAQETGGGPREDDQERGDLGGERAGGPGRDGTAAAQPAPAADLPHPLPGGGEVRPGGPGGGGPGTGAPLDEDRRVVADGPGGLTNLRVLYGDGPAWWLEFSDAAAAEVLDDEAEPADSIARAACERHGPHPMTADCPACLDEAAAERHGVQFTGPDGTPWVGEYKAPDPVAAATYAAQIELYAQGMPTASGGLVVPDERGGWSTIPAPVGTPNAMGGVNVSGQGPNPLSAATGMAGYFTPTPAPPDPAMSDADRARAAIAANRVSPAEFMAAATTPVLSGNTPWANRYAAELREIVKWHANHSDRNLQAHLGPSEIGHECDRNVVGKLVGMPPTNHVTDPWPSIRGVALHAWFEDTFQAENRRLGSVRWLPERRVTPRFEGHPGTADLYDAHHYSVDDHKVLGETTMAKVRSQAGPPIHYVVQMLTYADGYRREGYRVDRVALLAWPGTGSTLDGLYVWERLHTREDEDLLEYTGHQLTYRKQWANLLMRREAGLMDVPAHPSDDGCYFCPFYRPQSAKDGGPGCPGTVEPAAPAQAPVGATP